MNQTVSDNLPTKASLMAWAELQLEVSYSFNVTNGPNYIVPSPINLPKPIPARWLSDVAVLSPKCEWGEPHLDAYGDVGNFGTSAFIVSFAEQDLNMTVSTELVCKL